MENIESIVKAGECCGCEACINVCPFGALRYTKDKFDFSVPAIDDAKCISCGLCTKTCPAIHAPKKSPIRAYAAIAKDKQMRFVSSSGGIFGNIANHVLESGGVVFGCTMDDDLIVRHIAVESKEDLSKIQKSKYVQSRMTDVYAQAKRYLARGRMVLFSGTPCQVAAMNNFLNEKEKNFLLLVDVVCHGVPSQALFDDYISFLEKKKGVINEYQFRVKKIADDGMHWYSSYVLSKNNKQIVFDWTEDSYNYLYMMMYTNRDSCYSCKYASMERPSDITLCDYWHWDNYHKSFPAGATLSGVLINTEKGIAIFEKIKENFSIEDTKVGNIAAANGALCNYSGDIDKRNEVLTIWKNHGYQKLDQDFVAKHNKDIIKGIIRRHAPKSAYSVLSVLKKNLKRV